MPSDPRVHLSMRPGVPPQTERVEVSVTRRFEYDMNFFQDRFIVTARGRDRQGYSSIGLAPGALEEHPDETMLLVEEHFPHMRRTAIDGALELGYEEDLSRLRSALAMSDREVDHLKDIITSLRRPWWRKVYDRAGAWISGVR